MLRKISPDLESEHHRNILAAVWKMVEKWTVEDRWIMRLYTSWTLKRFLFAQKKGELYLAIEKIIREQNKKWQEPDRNPETFRLIQGNTVRIKTAIAANDSDMWKWISGATRHILEQYWISLADISIPFSQLDNLIWIYDLEWNHIDALSREDMMEMIATIPEILKIQL